MQEQAKYLFPHGLTFFALGILNRHGPCFLLIAVKNTQADRVF